MLTDLTIVIPCYNEEDNLELLLEELEKFCCDYNTQAIIVDDGSNDNSYQIIVNKKPSGKIKVIRNEHNLGYGGALKVGFRNVKTKWCITMDADGQHQFSDILKLFEKVEKEDLDLVVGKRQNFSSGIFRELGKKIILTVSKFLLTVKISDLNSGMKLYKTETLLKYLDLCPNGMSFSDIIVLIFIYYNNRIDEVDIIVKKRIGGKSTISFKTAYETIVEIFNIIMLFNPFKIFSLISLFLLILSFIWGIPILLAGKGISVGTGLLILTSVQFFLLGLISEQVSKIRKDIILLKNIIKKN